jgi:hypothetical protein
MYKDIFDVSTPGHETCTCKIHFSETKTPSSEYKDYLFNHYEKLEHVHSILDKFDSEHSHINWLYKHQIMLEGTTEFKVYKFIDMIGYDDTSVYIMYIKPQFNELNMNDFLIDSLITTYLLQNSKKGSKKSSKHRKSKA